MTENKRYQLRQEQSYYDDGTPILNCYSDLIDTENNDKVICSFDNDIGTSKMVGLLNKQDMFIKSLDNLIRTLNERILRQRNRIKEFASEEEVDLLTKREKEILDLRTRILELTVENNRLQCLIDDLGSEEMKRQMEVILNE